MTLNFSYLSQINFYCLSVPYRVNELNNVNLYDDFLIKYLSNYQIQNQDDDAVIYKMTFRCADM